MRYNCWIDRRAVPDGARHQKRQRAAVGTVALGSTRGVALGSMTYRIAEIFAGLEGEGHNPGTPTVRVRLQGCTRACRVRKGSDRQEALAPSAGQLFPVEEIVAGVLSFEEGLPHPYRWVGLSGGEPLEQTIEPLIWALQAEGKRVRVETS